MINDTFDQIFLYSLNYHYFDYEIVNYIGKKLMYDDRPIKPDQKYLEAYV